MKEKQQRLQMGLKEYWGTWVTPRLNACCIGLLTVTAYVIGLIVSANLAGHNLLQLQCTYALSDIVPQVEDPQLKAARLERQRIASEAQQQDLRNIVR